VAGAQGLGSVWFLVLGMPLVAALNVASVMSRREGLGWVRGQ
jgi:hypothetical protein